MIEHSILREGRNCWAKASCGRAAFLVDGEAYYSALADSLERAKRSVLILGWDIDSRVRLRRGEGKGGEPLGRFLNGLVSRRKDLHIHILDWDFAMLFAFEREPLPIFNLGWRTHRRVHFRLDNHHPLGASHHQKIVVVDDKIAFVGGFDLAVGRWDTPAHEADNPERVDNGTAYPPFHDVQMLVEGESARYLGELARSRWRQATGENLQAPETDGDPWPPGLRPDLENATVAIARTHPGYDGVPELREVETLYLDAIAAARSSIYIENQYFTSGRIATALAERLRDQDGPEVILILPRECSGWLEETTMGVLRARLLRHLREADRYDHLRIFYPANQDLGSRFINVHSKVLVIDDRLLRIGSSNLSNRSMGLDTECDLAVEANGNLRIRESIDRFRNRLLAEHLGQDVSAVATALREEGSLRGVIQRLNGSKRSLQPLNATLESWLDQIVPEADLLDPERPIQFEKFIQEFVPEEGHRMPRDLRFPRLVLLALLGVALLLAAAWRWTPLSEWVTLEGLRGWGETIRTSSWAPLFVTGAFLVGGLVILPVTLLILATVLTFGGWSGFSYALAGSLVSAVATYAIGRLLGRDAVRRIAGKRLNQLSRRLANQGLLATMIVRFLPVAPFSIVNMVAGASHIRLRDFFFGTLLGMAPGILAMSFFERSLQRVIRNPSLLTFGLLAGVMALIVLIFWGLRRWVKRREGGSSPESASNG